ncbi:MAG: hypothetical protein HC913_15690 [Microscillaceae bacterium]|nr:hypothetical protein [Microscillaceae bacterium]
MDLFFLQGNPDRGFGLCWGHRPTNDWCCFEVANTGFYILRRIKDNKWRRLVDWTPTGDVNPDGVPNRLRFVRVQDQMQGYLNVKKVFEIAAEDIPGQHTGFVLQGELKILADYLWVWAP